MTQTIHNVGDSIGSRYEIHDYIGAGGMQEVYAAMDTVLERLVALKVPKNSSATRRFKRSAVLSAKVSHPNAAKTLDYFEVDGRPYMVEELIVGQDLAKVRERLPIMDPYLVAHLLHHITRGVAASHHVGVVHRDLKPSNIMVSPGLSFSFVKITDFGIAKMAEEELASAAEKGEESITGSQTMVGALPYMAPEMIKTPRSTGLPADIWAIGSIAYELLSGTKPFGSGFVAVNNIINGPLPIAPSHIARPQFEGIGKEIYQIVRKCWERNHADRPTADDLVGLCSRLCYSVSDRAEGAVESIRFGAFGFIRCTAGQVFYHSNSVYGQTVSEGDTVCVSTFPGDPHPRAHPVVRLQPPTRRTL